MSFGHSGALLTAASGMYILGTIMIGTITAVGGGTIRDAITLGNRRFWTEETEYICLCLATAAKTFAIYSATTASLNREETKIEFASDSPGVAAFCVIGAMNGVRLKMPLLVCAVCGMAPATSGGVVRDVFVRERFIFHIRELKYMQLLHLPVLRNTLLRVKSGLVLVEESVFKYIP